MTVSCFRYLLPFKLGELGSFARHLQILTASSQTASSTKRTGLSQCSVKLITLISKRSYGNLSHLYHNQRKKTGSCFCVERIGNYSFLAGQNQEIHRCDVVNNSWVKLPEYGNNYEVNCLRSVHDYQYAISESDPP